MRPISPRNLYLLFSSSSSSLSCAPPFFLQVSHLSSSSAQHFHTQHSFRRLDEDVRNVRVSVWWDFENCHLPSGVNVFKVAHRITAALRVNGINGPVQITAFGDMLQLSRANQEALSSTGIILTHVPNGGKNSADRSLLADLMYWVSQNPPPAHLLLISGDRDFASILHRLRMNNYNILLAGPENTPGVLCSAASIMWPWHALLMGENPTGKYFNQPPDGPYGSWYGHYKVPLEDPFIEQPAFSQTEKLTDPHSDSKPCMIPTGSDSKHCPIPKAVMKRICQLLKSHPKGISISDLRSELQNLNLDTELYGYKKFTLFLLAMPHILRLQPLGKGNFLIHGVTPKSPEPFECSQGMSTGPVNDNGNQELNLGSQLDCDDRSINGTVDGKLSLPTSTEPNAEEPYRELQQPFSLHSSLTKASDGKSLLLPFSENVKPSSPHDEKSPSPSSPKNVKCSAPINEKVEVDKAQGTEFHLPLVVAQNSASEVGYFKRVWRKWFGSRDNASGTRSLNDQEESCTSVDGIEKEGHNTPEKYFTSVDNPGKGKDKEKFVTSTGEVVDPPPASSSSSHNESAQDNKTATSSEVTNESETSPGLFDKIVNFRKFWRTSPRSDKLSDQSHDKLNLMDTHCQEHMLFSKNSFWSDMESFMDTPNALFLVSESRTRKQMALYLKKEGPLCLRSLEKSDLLHLVDLLISEKKWVEECPSKKSPFKLTQRNEKNSLDHSHGSIRLRSIFLGKPSQHDMQRSPEHGEKTCQNIPHTGVALPVIKKIESSHTIPPCTTPKMFVMETSVPDIQKDIVSNTVVNSDDELSDVSWKNDDSDSPWEELGPIASTISNKNEVEIASRRKAIGSTNFYYEPSLSDDFSDSDGETMPTTGSEGRVKNKVNNEPSSLLQILDSWYSNKDGDISKYKSDNVDGFVDSANVSKLSGSSGVGIKSGTSLGNNARTQRPRKSYSFVADAVGGDKDKFIDGILGSLNKKSEPSMES